MIPALERMAEKLQSLELQADFRYYARSGDVRVSSCRERHAIHSFSLNETREVPAPRHQSASYGSRDTPKSRQAQPVMLRPMMSCSIAACSRRCAWSLDRMFIGRLTKFPPSISLGECRKPAFSSSRILVWHIKTSLGHRTVSGLRNQTISVYAADDRGMPRTRHFSHSLGRVFCRSSRIRACHFSLRCCRRHFTRGQGSHTESLIVIQSDDPLPRTN